eukprot:9498484-Lingulodinium_polyedra.AAC.1
MRGRSLSSNASSIAGAALPLALPLRRHAARGKRGRTYATPVSRPGQPGSAACSSCSGRSGAS